MNNILPGFIDSLPEKDEFREKIPMRRYGKSLTEIGGGRGLPGFGGRSLHHGPEHPRDGGITRSV